MAANPNPVLSESSINFYRHALAILKEADVPTLVGGAYAYARYTGIERHTKDFDVFIREQDFPRAAKAFEAAGYDAELTFPHWLGKAFHNDDFVDLIFSAGNGVAAVDDRWFEHAVKDQVFGVDVELIPAEEMIWSKGLIMERERFDGADVAHVMRAVGDRLDWKRLVERYDVYWRALYAHVILFGFIYPSDRDKVPSWVLEELTRRVLDETRAGNAKDKVCYGTIVSRQQYLKDVNDWGYDDARLTHATMTEADIAHWTAGIAVDGAK
ncbi:MAG: nucleotidyltransferase family protein [Acidobacteriota bacterium]|nr:nucleotidyltransferase family protein [Acidobacteriota bacterium]